MVATKKILSIFLAAVLLFSVINPTYVSAKKQSNFLSKAKMLADYDTMWNIIEENYPCMGVAERLTGNDFNKVKTTYRKRIHKNTTKKEYTNIIKDCLSQFKETAYMSMLDKENMYAYYLETYKKWANSHGHCKFNYNQLNNNQSMKFYNYKKNKKSNSENTENSGNSSLNNVNFTTNEYKDIQTAYIKIPGFDNPEINAPALEQYFNKISDYKDCILDLRGNKGGSRDYWMFGIIASNLKEDISFKFNYFVKGAQSKKYIESEMAPCNPIKSFDCSSMTNINLDDVADMDYYGQITWKLKKSENPIFKGNFYVLTDKNVSYSADFFIQFCKQTGFAKLIGETTGGKESDLDPMMFSLPNSGICFMFSSPYYLNMDGSCAAEKGTQPDIDCTGKDSLEVCLDYIRGTDKNTAQESKPTQTPVIPTKAPTTPTEATKYDKVIALTFDDGPDAKLTPLVLDKLEKYNVPATFMMIGQKVNDSTSAVIKRMIDSGCEIGNHSWGYSNMNNMSEAEIKKSINDTNAAILKYSGTTPKFFRAPYLGTSKAMFKAIDLTFIQGVTSRDWDQSTTAEQRADLLIKGAKDGAILVMHDVQPLPHPTPEALDIVIPALQKEGYKFVTLSELFKLKGVTLDPNDDKIYTYVP